MTQLYNTSTTFKGNVRKVSDYLTPYIVYLLCLNCYFVVNHKVFKYIKQ